MVPQCRLHQWWARLKIEKIGSIKVEINQFMGKVISPYGRWGEGCAHPVRIDWCSLVRGEVEYHRCTGLEVAPDAGGEYKLLVPSGWGGNPCTWWDFSNSAMVEAQEVIHGEVFHQHSLSLEVILLAADDWETKRVGASRPLSEDSHRPP